jgi:hypothetical protein
MPESTTPTFAWARTNVPPLRADIERRRREYRRVLARVERNGWLTLSALLGASLGAITALCTCTGALI